MIHEASFRSQSLDSSNHVIEIKEEPSFFFFSEIQVRLTEYSPWLRVAQELSEYQFKTLSHKDIPFRVVFVQTDKPSRYFLIDSEDAKLQLVKTEYDALLFQKLNHSSAILPRKIHHFSKVLFYSIYQSLQQTKHSVFRELNNFSSIAEFASEMLFVSEQCRHKTPYFNLFKGQSFCGNDGILVSLKKDRRILLGEGGCKRVFHDIWIEQDDMGRLLAMDVASSKAKNIPYAVENLRHEVTLCRTLPNHNHFLLPFACFNYSSDQNRSYDKSIVVSPLAEGTLFCFLSKLSDFQKIKAMKALAIAVDVLHSRGWRHGDLKPENCLVFNHGEHFSLADFGLLDNFENPWRPGGTLDYLAPEIIEARRARKDLMDYGKVDAWALGLTFCQILTQQLPICWNFHLQPLDQGQITQEELQSVVDLFLLEHRATLRLFHSEIEPLLRGLLTVDVTERWQVKHTIQILEQLFPNS